MRPKNIPKNVFQKCSEKRTPKMLTKTSLYMPLKRTLNLFKKEPQNAQKYQSSRKILQQMPHKNFLKSKGNLKKQQNKLLKRPRKNHLKRKPKIGPQITHTIDVIKVRPNMPPFSLNKKASKKHLKGTPRSLIPSA